MLTPAAAGRGPASRLHSKPPPRPRTLSTVSGSASSGPAVGWVFHELDCGSWALLLYRGDSVPYDGRASGGPWARAVPTVSHAGGCSVSGAGPVPGMLPHPSGPGTGGYAVLTAACGKLSESACRGSAGMPLLHCKFRLRFQVYSANLTVGFGRCLRAGDTWCRTTAVPPMARLQALSLQ